MDVSSWLRDLGLENYASVFRTNDIEFGLLSRLTAEDLMALGVMSVGHGRKLLDAIALLKDSTAPAAAESTATALRPLDAERRQLTVLLCDLVGSTALAARLDPEDLGDAGIPGGLRGGRQPVPRPCRQVSGRRRPGLF